MAFLPEVAQWTEDEDNIYQFELNDFITGGPRGNDNEPHRILGNRTAYLKKKQEEIVDNLAHLNGFKNLWINGNFQIWDYGTSGIVGGDRYETNRLGFRIIQASDGSGSGGVATWEQVIEDDRNAIAITHKDAVDFGYFFSRFDAILMNMLRGKTVTLSFEYKFPCTMQGYAGIRTDGNNDGIFESIAGEDTEITYVGDGNWHKAEITFMINDNFVLGNYMQVLSKYFDNTGAIPDGTYCFSRIQLEIGNKATDIEILSFPIERIRANYYYRVIPFIRSSVYSTRFHINYAFGTQMRTAPAIECTLSDTDAKIDYDNSNEHFVSLLITSSATAVTAYDVVCDAEIY